MRFLCGDGVISKQIKKEGYMVLTMEQERDIREQIGKIASMCANDSAYWRNQMVLESDINDVIDYIKRV